jgi:AcrR family transcriptional regulator
VPRAGLTAQSVVEEAERFVDEHGLDALTLAGLAERLGVRQPSLYKHIDSVAALRRDIGVRAAREVTEVMRRAAVGRSGSDAIQAIAIAHREWAQAHPSRYRLSQKSPIAGDAEHERIAEDYLALYTAVLSGLGLTGADAIDAIRGLRSALHGFVILELDGEFQMPYDLDRSYRRMVAAFVGSLSSFTS